MANASAPSIEDAWNSVALEERLELVAQCQAQGVHAALCFALYMSCIAYGFDQIFFLLFALAGSFLVFPVYAAKKWRQAKPALIMRYLAAHAVCRRYAYGLKFSNYNLVLLFRATLHEQFTNPEQEQLHLAKRGKELGVDLGNNDPIDVWVALLRGGVVILSEQRGGAKLEYCASLMNNLQSKAEPNLEVPGTQLVRLSTTSGNTKDRKVWLTSRYSGALYVFDKQLNRLSYEQKETREREELIRIAIGKRSSGR